ncbi:hypothetical protein BDY19DRAFT_1012764 [Irpex rosettiformis]|uniref:Uncharacterized protein n=1 Tax=Irpex rosettiformis TaxID=378272 RepID=A0ACB8UGT2_9APHY|nr:hypothetical protein BDY19DRAFT_1012764 [Irpex rosettiformis]
MSHETREIHGFPMDATVAIWISDSASAVGLLTADWPLSMLPEHWVNSLVKIQWDSGRYINIQCSMEIDSTALFRDENEFRKYNRRVAVIVQQCRAWLDCESHMLFMVYTAVCLLFFHTKNQRVLLNMQADDKGKRPQESAKQRWWLGQTVDADYASRHFVIANFHASKHYRRANMASLADGGNLYVDILEAHQMV